MSSSSLLGPEVTEATFDDNVDDDDGDDDVDNGGVVAMISAGKSGI